MRLCGICALFVLVAAAVASCSNCGPSEPPCQSDSDCSSSQRCDLSSNTCVARAPFADAATDAVVADVPVFDAATDAGACASATCPDNTVCIETSGGHECRCGSTNVCREDEECVPRQIAVDGGNHPAVRCCPRGHAYCDDRCVDVAGDPHHCGRCFNSCPTLVCANSACACTETWQCTGNPPANTVPRCVTDGGVLTSGDAGGRIGNCDYELCVEGYDDCIGTEPGCETDLLTSAQHCGACNRSAVVRAAPAAIDAAGYDLPPISASCLNGQPRCGSNAPCDGGVCVVPPGADAGAAQCVQCADPWHCRQPSGSPNFCCRGECHPLTSTDYFCGCEADPFSNVAYDTCTSFHLETPASTTTVHGYRCVDPGSGNLADADSVARSRCGCNASGVEQCSELNYTSKDLWDGVLLAGLCNTATHQCEQQSVSQCGVVGGVVAPFDAGTVGGLAGATCNPATGGPLCADYPVADKLGTCGCGTLNNSFCATPVYSPSTTRMHVVANICGVAKSCICGNQPGPCDTNSDGPDCCEYDCTDLAHSEQNCGTCGTVCDESTTSTHAHLAQCTFQVSGVGAGAAQCYCTASSGEGDPTEAQCPNTGGGGGQTCGLGNKCVCSTNGSQPCPIGTYCCGGNPINFQASGCCLQGCANLSAPNQCAQPGGCSGLKWTCTNGSAFWCCADGMKCGTGVGDCLVAP